ncbi:MAG: TRAP transporter substrate-binding protein DctP [Rhodospirillum sp.]|nr:TRAP transporter substrate-binding protein DctP [Rhodospirillum sp.]MCF8489408.1 TRAP transporter substrate-binding protein DctP [Rhodospirillum sp.]
MNKFVGGLLGAGLLVASSLAAQAAETTIRISLQLPMKSHLGQNLLMFKDEVESKSKGAIEVQIYDSAQLFKDSEVPQAVGQGQIEAGVASLTRYVGDIPAVDIFYMPFLFNTEDLVRKATAPGSPVRAPLDAAIAKTGSKVLWWQAYGGNILLTKGAPLKGPADMKDKKARVFSKALGTWTETLGGGPTMISGSEQYLAYQRGTVDIGMTGISGVSARKLWEVMDTITRTNNADIEFIVVMNEDFFNGLPKDQQEIVTTAARNAEVAVRDYVSTMENDAFKEAADNGMTVYEPSAEEITAWREASQPVIDLWLKDAGPLGEEVYKAALSLGDGK